jgi:hypothetical protein
VAAERKNDFSYFQKCLNSVENSLIHNKIIRAPKIVKIIV